MSNGLGEDIAHAGATHSLADGLRIVGVVFVGLHIGLHKLRTHEPHLMAERPKSSTPIVGAAAHFHPNPTRREISNKRD